MPKTHRALRKNFETDNVRSCRLWLIEIGWSSSLRSYHGQPGSWQRTIQNLLHPTFVDDPVKSHRISLASLFSNGIHRKPPNFRSEGAFRV